jgi:hypothetical protein
VKIAVREAIKVMAAKGAAEEGQGG